MTLRPGREGWALAALVVLHVLLGVYYSVVIPVWEAHDEDGHYYFARYLATEHRLPPPGHRSLSNNDEMHQPPLYYALAALPVSAVRVDQELTLKPNPYMHWTGAQGGHNRFIHDATVESWPYSGAVLAVHVARWVSVLLGTLGLLFTFWTARLLCPSEPRVRWGAVLVLAFWPQYRFTTAVINNDIMVTVCAGAVTWLLVRVAVAPQVRAFDLLALGAATGLAPLSKGNGLALVPAVLVGVVGSLLSAKQAVGRRLLVWLTGAIAVGSVVVGWWYVYNLHRGAGVFGGSRSIAWLRQYLQPLLGERRFHWELLLPALRHGLFSLWAGFGWNNVGLPIPLYWVALVWSLLGLLGVAAWVLRRPPRKPVAGAVVVLLVAASMLIVPLLLEVARGGKELQGRGLLPAMPAASVLLSLGWTTLVPGRGRTVSWIVMGGALGLLAAATPMLYLRPAYALPARLTEAQASEYTPVQARFGDFAELVGYRISEQSVDPGDALHLTLVWRALTRTEADLTLAVQLFAGDRRLLGEAHRFPGRGSLPTSTWEPGYLFAEQVSIAVKRGEQDARLAWLELSFYDHSDLSPTVAFDAAGRRLGYSLRIGRVKIAGSQPPSPGIADEGFQFGQAIRLIEGEADAQVVGGTPWIDLELYWTARDRPSVDYTVSVQLRHGQDSIVAQVDGQSRQGTYPTSAWDPGELIPEQYTLFLPGNLPAGDYGLYVCLYELATLQRLPVIDPQGQWLVNDEAQLLGLAVDGGGALRLRSASFLIRAGPETPGDGLGQVPGTPAQHPAGVGGAGKEQAIVSGLKAADRRMVAGQEEDALRILRRKVLPLDRDSLPALYRMLMAQHGIGGETPVRAGAAVDERLRHFALGSVAVPAEPRLGLYLAQTMADLVDGGIWTRDTLLRVVAYQVWQFAEGSRGQTTERVIQALVNRYPHDPDLLFYQAELWHRQGDLERAAVAYGEVLEVDATYAPAYLRLGMVAEARSRTLDGAQESIQEALDWYARYHRLALDDVQGLSKLAELSEALRRPEARALREELVAKTDERRIAAEMLDAPAEGVELGLNLVENGAFEAWEGNAPIGWRFGAYLGRGGNQGLYFAGEDTLAAAGKAARIVSLWGGQMPDATTTYAEYVGESLTVADGKYLISLRYCSQRFLQGSGLAFLGDYAHLSGLVLAHQVLPDTAGQWRVAFLLVDGPEAATSVVPLVRNWGVGDLWAQAMDVRPVTCVGGLGR